MEENKPNKTERSESAIKKQTVKKYATWGVITFVIVVVIWGFVTAYKNRSQISESDIISRMGIHTHPELAIYVKGIKQEMPASLGVRPSFMAPVHTHEPNGVIHLEFQGLVQKKDITLEQFFKIWGKDINSFGTNMKMTVNGKESTDYGNYLMQDKDKIELRYE